MGIQLLQHWYASNLIKDKM